MSEKPSRTEDTTYALLLCLAVFALAAWQIRSFQSRFDKQEIVIPGDPGIPAITFGARGSQDQPAVIIAHGLSASKEMMQTLGLEVARMGVAVYLFDFPGHGDSTAPFRFDLRGQSEEAIDHATDGLTAYLERVYNFVRDQHGGEAARIALIGHSMGSVVVTRFAMDHPEVEAVVSISPPSSGEITQSRPPNLLLLVGQWDIPQSVAGVRKALAAATDAHAELGMTYGDFSRGTARRAILLPRLDHIAIIFSPATAAEINRWLQNPLQVLYAVPTGIVRLLWLLVANLAAVLTGLLLVSPLHGLLSRFSGEVKPPAVALPAQLGAAEPEQEHGAAMTPSDPAFTNETGGRWRISVAQALGYLVLFVVASGLAVLFLSVRTPFTFLRLLIGDYLTSYFFLAGVLLFVIARIARRDIPLAPWPGTRTQDSGAASGWVVNRQALRELPVSVAVFIVLFLMPGLLENDTWIHFIPTPARWARFLPVFLLSMPFFLADEAVFRALQESSPVGSGVMSLLGKLVVLATLAAGALLSPGNTIVILILPAMLVFFVLFQLYSLRIYHVTRSPLATATLNALLVAWVMVAVFPIT